MSFSAVESGLLRRGSERLGRRYPSLKTPTRIAIFVGLTFVPPAVLAAIEGRLVGPGWVFSRDVAALVRFIGVGPLLIGLEELIRQELSAAVRRWSTDGLVPPDRVAAFDRTVQRLQRLQHSWWPVVLALVGAYALTWVELYDRRPLMSQRWIFDPDPAGGLSLAGGWYALVSVPLLYHSLLRWLWRFALWDLLLMRLARLPPRVFALHPDRRGGLDDVVRAHNLWSWLLLALSSLAAAAIANQMVHTGVSLAEARTAAIVFVVIVLAVFLGPLAAFSPLLLRLRRRAAFLYGEAAARHTADFEAVARRMVPTDPESGVRIPDQLLENQANFATSFDALREMKSTLLTLDTLKVFGLAALVPLLLAALAKVPAAELAGKLRELLI